nr:hypothetical protein [Tanacetum cinerariifolium]
DKIICDLNKTPDLSQRPPQNRPKCGNPIEGQYCQGCALLRKKFKEDLFTYCIENGILQDSFEPSNDNTNVVNALQEPFVVNLVLGAHYGFNCLPKVSIIPDPKPCHNQTVDELPKIMPSFDPTCYSEDGNSFTYDSISHLVHDSPNDFNQPSQPPFYSCEFYENDALDELPQIVPSFDPTCYSEDGNSFTYDSISHLVHDSPNDFNQPSQPPFYSCEFYENDAQQAAKARYWKILVCYDDEDYTIAITHKEPDNSLSMGDEHLDTIPARESNKFIKSSVEYLVPNPSESEGEHEFDVPACEDFTKFSNILFYVDYDFSSSDDQLFYDEDILKEIYSNLLFNEEIFSMKIDPHHFNAESDLIESLLNHDSLIISSSSKIDSLFDEFAEEFISENSDTAIESFSLSPIPVEDNDSLMEEINLSFNLDDPMPPGIKEDDYDSKRDILILEELLSNDSLSLPENESFYFDIPSSFRPPAKPPD